MCCFALLRAKEGGGKKMQKRKGISLIVLVITIIVMIILAGAIILSLNNAGIIGKANQAVEKTNVNQVQTLAELKWSEAYLNNQRELWQLKKAVREGLEAEGINLNEYHIEITTKGTVVDVKENTEVVSEEIIGADGDFKYVKLANGKIQISKYLVEGATSVTIPAQYDGYDVYSVGHIEADMHASAKQYNIFGENNSSNSTITSITISEGVKEIKVLAFSGCDALTTITLPSTLKTIGTAAFRKCTGLINSLNIPEGVTAIGDFAFMECSSFTNLVLPQTLETIGDYAFRKCEGLNSELLLPKGVTSIGRGAFWDCTNLTGTVIIAGITVGDIAFKGTQVTVI